MPSTIFPHAEERSGVAGARLEARTAPMRRILASLTARSAFDRGR
jgi:hypothetical protein